MLTVPDRCVLIVLILFLQRFFKPAMDNIRGNLGEGVRESVLEEQVRCVLLRVLEEAKLMYSPRPATPATPTTTVHRRHCKKSRSTSSKSSKLVPLVQGQGRLQEGVVIISKGMTPGPQPKHSPPAAVPISVPSTAATPIGPPPGAPATLQQVSTIPPW